MKRSILERHVKNYFGIMGGKWLNHQLSLIGVDGSNLEVIDDELYGKIRQAIVDNGKILIGGDKVDELVGRLDKLNVV